MNLFVFTTLFLLIKCRTNFDILPFSTYWCEKHACIYLSFFNFFYRIFMCNINCFNNYVPISILLMYWFDFLSAFFIQFIQVYIRHIILLYYDFTHVGILYMRNIHCVLIDMYHLVFYLWTGLTFYHRLLFNLFSLHSPYSFLYFNLTYLGILYMCNIHSVLIDMYHLVFYFCTGLNFYQHLLFILFSLHSPYYFFMFWFDIHGDIVYV